MKARALRRLARDKRGAIAPMVAILGTALIGVSGIALDISLYYAMQRNLQAVTQAAALSAAIDPSNAQTRAQNFLKQNGYDPSVLQSVTIGRYCPNIATASTSRFTTVAAAPADCPGNGSADAVQLSTATASQRYLTSVFGNAAVLPQVTASATAARIDEAGLEMTSGTLSLTPGLVNTLLTALVGVNINLTTLQLQGLLNSHVDAGLMFDALATEVGETGTYGTLVARTVSMADLLNACATAMQEDGADTNAIAGMQMLASTIGTRVQVPLSGLFQLGVWKDMPVGNGQNRTALRAGLNAYQLVMYAIETKGVSTTLLGLNVAGLANTSIRIGASGPIAHARFGFGPAGQIAVSTVAVRLLISLQVTGLMTGPLQVMLDLGEGAATINSISCGQEASTDAQVQVGVTGGMLGAYIGTLPSSVMQQPFTTITAAQVQPASLGVSGLASVGLSAVAVPIGYSGTRNFVQSGASGGDGIIGHPPNGGTPASVGNQTQLATLLSSMPINLTVCAVLNICVNTGPLVSPLLSSVSVLIGTLAIDPTVTGLLYALGVVPGYTTAWVTGARCGVPVLI